MPGFAFIAVDPQPLVFVTTVFFGGLQVDHVEIAAGREGRETTIVTHAEQEPSPVRADASQGVAPPRLLHRENGFRAAPLVARKVVADSHEVVLDLVIRLRRHRLHVRPAQRRAAEVEMPAVR